nr:unnamed protein product [Callosobruchus chinensis]
MKRSSGIFRCRVCDCKVHLLSLLISPLRIFLKIHQTGAITRISSRYRGLVHRVSSLCS